MSKTNSSVYIFWLQDPRMEIHRAIDYYYQPGYHYPNTMEYLTHFLALKNYFLRFLNPDRWEAPKSEISELRDMAAQCANFDELDELRDELIELGIDPINPEAY
jgi:hypothetical protein